MSNADSSSLADSSAAAPSREFSGASTPSDQAGDVRDRLGDHPAVLFDGVCNLCAWSVQFILKRDPEGDFRFASLQSEIGTQLTEGCGLDSSRLDSVVLVQSGQCHSQSSAALRIARRLRFPWPLLYAFIIVPRPLRDWAYRLVAGNRYRLFGKREQCWLPSENWQKRFLDSSQ